MLKLFGGLLLAFGACALGLAAFGRLPVHAGVGVSLMCSGIAWALTPFWYNEERAPPADAAPKPAATLEPVKKGSVAPFMAERLTRLEGAQVAAADLFAAYSAWCALRGVTALDAVDFNDRLSTLCDLASIRRNRLALINVTLG